MNSFTFFLKSFFLSLALIIGNSFASNAQTFNYKDSGTTFILYDLSIPAGQNSIAYAAGSKYTFDTEGVIIKTLDGGETWETIYPLSGTSTSFEKIEFLNENKGFVAGYDLFMKTEDGGATWTPITVGTDVYLYNNLSFYNENVGFVSAQLNDAPYFAIYLTIDGGETWNPATDVFNAGAISMAFADESTLFSVGADEKIAKSTDGGDTWNQIYSGIIQNYFVSTYFKDVNNGVVAGEDGLLKTTHDSGETWSDFSSGYHHFYGLAYKANEIMAAGTDDEIYFSEDNGETFNLLFAGAGQNQLYAIEFFEDGSGLVSGSGGTIIKFEDVFLGSDSNVSMENEFVSFYNSDTQRYQIESKNEKIESVNIYTITGQLIGKFSNDSNNFSADVSGYSKGVYLVKVESNYHSSSLKFLKK